MRTGRSRDELAANIDRLQRELAAAQSAYSQALQNPDSFIGLPSASAADSTADCTVRIDAASTADAAHLDAYCHNASDVHAAILHDLPGIVFIIDVRSRACVFVNHAVVATLGYTPEEIKSLGGDLVSTLVHPDDISRALNHLQLLADTDSDQWLTIELRIRDRADNWHWIISRATACQRDADDQPTRVLAVVIEITKRKAAEEELRTSEERHRVLAETMLQGVVHQDAAGRIISMNPASERILGKPRERFLGSTSMLEEMDTIREDGTVFPGSEHPSMLALATGKTIRGVVMGVWNPTVAAYRWIRVDAVPVLRPEVQKPVEVYAVFEDITEDKMQELQLNLFHQRLEESYALLDTLSAKAPIGLAFVDCDFRFQRVNETLAAINCRPIAAHIGHAVAELLPELWKDVEGSYQRALAGEAVVNVELASIDLQTQCRRHWLTSYYPVAVDNQIIGIGVVVVEVTAQKQIEQALKDADRHKDEFLATLAHELRNPLAPIRASVEILKLRASDDLELAISRDVIDRQVSHMARLLEDLLDVSRMSRNTLELRREHIELHEILQLALETSRPIIDGNQHQLLVTLPDQPIPLFADSVRLAQVFANLLNNAAKYTEPGGQIWLQAQCVDNSVHVAVRDSGIGIAPEIQPTIFEIFSQADPALQRSQGGLGIGLSLVKGLVELHGATIEVFSEGLTYGSTFTVHLPLVSPPAKLASAPAIQPKPEPKYCRILVADDMRDNADTLGMMLRVLGNEVLLVYGGEEAVLAADEFRPHIALLDIGMPKVNGYETAQRIRSQPWGQNIMLVALTGWAREEDRKRTRAAGFDHHLVKPVALASIIELIEQTQ